MWQKAKKKKRKAEKKMPKYKIFHAQQKNFKIEIFQLFTLLASYSLILYCLKLGFSLFYGKISPLHNWFRNEFKSGPKVI